MKRGQNTLQSRSSRLHSIDKKLIQLLAERSQLLARDARERKGNDKSYVDPEKEKKLWSLWRQGLEEHGLNERILRRTFNLVNSLAYEQAERREDWVMALHPRLEAVDIDLPGPVDTVKTRLWLIMGAVLGRDVRIPGAVLNDDLIELIKACNQAGAGMSWDQEGASSGTVCPQFDHSSIFVGQDPLNFYLLLGLSLTSPAVCRFNGGARLKSESMGFLTDVLAEFGARQVFLVPGSDGVPIRVEASGQVPSKVRVPEEAPDEFVLALLLLAPVWARANGEFRLVLNADLEQFRGKHHLIPIWSQLGAVWEQDGKELIFSGSELTMPQQPEVGLDPVLAGYVLAMPAFCGGRVLLHGTFPQAGPERDAFLELSSQAGLDVDVREGGIESKSGGMPKADLRLSCRQSPRLIPLALALALAGGQESILGLSSGQDMDFAAHILASLGMESEQITDQELRIRPARGRQREDLAVTAPNACWSLGLALMALAGAKVSIKNPGVLTSLWPQFWTLYKNLPRPRAKSLAGEDKKEESGHGPKRRRRIVD
ncbi:chorismate mutase [Desulfovermiculus halophilus]|uniref:chorismate mutase n=1 Tax=Desulfovermiculus halophilus TaxID=339722 RepID=UPI0004867A42|nr:chorismate mutase [Desulfovermiculus halophilus]